MSTSSGQRTPRSDRALPALDPAGLLDAAPCGFVAFADDGRILWSNTTFAARLGYDRSDLIGRNIETVFTVGGRLFYQTHLFPLVRLHGHAEEIFMLLRTSSGEEVGMLCNAVRRAEAVPRTDCVFIEVRERRKFEQALLEARRTADEARQAADAANEAKSQFLAMMSHELRTPLNAIGGYTQLLETGVYGSMTPEQLTALGRIVRSQVHLLGLINDVLNLAKIETGRVDFNFTEVPLSQAVSELTAMIAPQMGAKHIHYAVEMEAPNLTVRADREKLVQIILNLLSNAVKFTPDGGAITVRASSSPQAVTIDVIDAGRGIPADQLEAIFEPFVQVRNDPTESRQGTGLGLAISRNLARGMGGDLTATSTVGVGSCFTIRLPRV